LPLVSLLDLAVFCLVFVAISLRTSF
jgi:hypothetical protein